MRKKMVGCGILLGILMVISIGFWVYLDYLDKKYEQIQAELPAVKSKLATLNHTTLTHFPPPDHVTEIEREDWGINTDYQYGVATNIFYRIEDSELDVQSYYQFLMESSGWVLAVSKDSIPQDADYRAYFHEETCVEIETYHENKESYQVLIYHDFEKQDFTPKLLPMWYVKGIRQYGKTGVATCP